MAHMINCRWTSDTTKVVLEIQAESSKQCNDAEPCSMRQLLHEMEEQGICDVKVRCHSCVRPGDAAGAGAVAEAVWGQPFVGMQGQHKIHDHISINMLYFISFVRSSYFIDHMSYIINYMS